MTARPDSTCHPDRAAPTLAQLVSPAAHDDAWPPPDPGSADARVDLKLLAWRAQRALETRGTDAARERLGSLTSEHLWAGTVQDGAARGFAVALEEAISLCEPAPPTEPTTEPDTVLAGRELRRKRDLLVASAGARVRFSRKGGVLFVDRKQDVHVENMLCFEDRTDTGTLDAFEPLAEERPRLFHPGFLHATRYEQGAQRDALLLEGPLGRRPHGYLFRLKLEGRKTENVVRLTIAVCKPAPRPPAARSVPQSAGSRAHPAPRHPGMGRSRPRRAAVSRRDSGAGLRQTPRRRADSRRSRRAVHRLDRAPLCPGRTTGRSGCFLTPPKHPISRRSEPVPRSTGRQPSRHRCK